MSYHTLQIIAFTLSGNITVTSFLANSGASRFNDRICSCGYWSGFHGHNFGSAPPYMFCFILIHCFIQYLHTSSHYVYCRIEISVYCETTHIPVMSARDRPASLSYRDFQPCKLFTGQSCSILDLICSLQGDDSWDHTSIQ